MNVIDTTGAGDNFAAGFIKSYIEGEKHKDCLENANKIASFVCRKWEDQ